MAQPNNNNPTLASNPASAVQQLIRISQNLLTLAEKETQALLLSDMLAFSILQYEKEKLAVQYTNASTEFRSRLGEFHGTDRALVLRLEKLQRDLGEKTHGNNMLVDQLKRKAETIARKRILRAPAMQGQNILTEGA